MTSKVSNFIKQYFFMLALAATFIGFSAFNYVEQFEDPENGWYEVTPSPIDPDDPELQAIGDKLLVDPPTTDSTQCAQQFNQGHMCAIELTFEAGAEKPETVQEADDDSLVEIEAEARQPRNQN